MEELLAAFSGFYQTVLGFLTTQPTAAFFTAHSPQQFFFTATAQPNRP